jgi:hypothetical protein
MKYLFPLMVAAWPLVILVSLYPLASQAAKRMKR